MLREQFELQKFGLVLDEPEDFSICCWQRTTQVQGGWIAYRTILFGIFLGFFLYVVIFWVTQNDLDSGDKPKILIFLTYWTFFLETFLFFWGLLVAVVDYVKQRRGTDVELSVIAKVFWVLYTVVLPCAVSVTVIFWSLVYDNKLYKPNAPNILIHVFNTVLIFVDFWLVAFPFRFLHFYMAYVYAFVYVIFSVIYELSGGTGPKGTGPIYKILNWKEKPLKSFLFVLLACVVVFAIHFFFSFLYLFKIWLVKKYI